MGWTGCESFECPKRAKKGPGRGISVGVPWSHLHKGVLANWMPQNWTLSAPLPLLNLHGLLFECIKL